MIELDAKKAGYDEYRVYITLPTNVHLSDVLEAGLEALDIVPSSAGIETDWMDHYNV